MSEMQATRYNDNERYIAGCVAGISDPDRKATNAQKMRAAMAKYGDHRWWLSEDPREVAYYQLHEPVVLVQFRMFHSALKQLVGRAVQTLEFELCYEQVLAEADTAWAAYQQQHYEPPQGKKGAGER